MQVLPLLVLITRFTTKNNSDTGCCGSFTSCVECCLTSDHQTMLRFQIYALSTRGFPGIDIAGFFCFVMVFL